MRGIVHEPQVNIGADQKFSPVDVFKQEKEKGGQTLGFQWIDQTSNDSIAVTPKWSSD